MWQADGRSQLEKTEVRTSLIFFFGMTVRAGASVIAISRHLNQVEQIH
jgi:hypothetical protein